MRNIVACHWGHDASVCFWNDTEQRFHTIEIEKLTGIKHYRGHLRRDEEVEILRECQRIAETEFGMPNQYAAVIRGSIRRLTDIETDANGLASIDAISQVFNTAQILVHTKHHWAHATSGYSQSPFEKALIITMDGGGDDGLFHVYRAESRDKRFEWITNFNMDEASSGRYTLGRRYNDAAFWTCPNIMHNTDNLLDVAGKVMGASAYGDMLAGYDVGAKAFSQGFGYIGEHANPALSTYYQFYTSNDLQGKKILNDLISDSPELFNPYQMFLPKEFDWETECSIAKGIQDAFCTEAMALMDEYIKEYAQDLDNNIVFNGGCALNVILNKRLQDQYPHIDFYVPPNPTDVGLPHGMICKYMARSSEQEHFPKWHKPITYSGTRLLDRKKLPDYMEIYPYSAVGPSEIAQVLRSDKIVGLVQGGIEVGARALGNRSILADPKGEHKKDLVNKVKRREPYRPFAPICRYEDARKYFVATNYDNLQYMNYAVDTREEYIEELRAVTHVDGTARLQTVKYEDNPFMYDLLTQFDGVLLNTSFNVKGKPILNTLKEAFYMLDETPLDHLVIVDDDGQAYMFNKKA